MKQIAIIGLSTTWGEAPANDPDWEAWGLGNDPRHCLYDKIFEIHTLDSLNERERKRVERQLVELKDRLVTRENFPFKEIERFWPHGLDSTIAYMLAQAMLEVNGQPHKIGIWGVDMASDDEYACQRENMLKLLGYAEGAGFNVWVHPKSKLNLPKRYYPCNAEDGAVDPDFLPENNPRPFRLTKIHFLRPQ